MYVPFTSLPDTSRIWVFQSNRPFDAGALSLIEKKLRAFTEEWTVHGSPVETSYAIRFNRFIILAADEGRQRASGCSIDSSVRVLKEIEQSIGIQLFDRNQVAFKLGNEVVLVPVQELKQKFQAGILNEDSLAFNNLVNTKEEFEKKWLLPAGETWLKRYIPNHLAKVK